MVQLPAMCNGNVKWLSPSDDGEIENKPSRDASKVCDGAGSK
jgi:hypothetical protein